jgi:hypothetical protein
LKRRYRAAPSGYPAHTRPTSLCHGIYSHRQSLKYSGGKIASTVPTVWTWLQGLSVEKVGYFLYSSQAPFTSVASETTWKELLRKWTLTWCIHAPVT